MLATLSGKKHEVYTGVCMISEEKKLVFHSVSTVYMRPLDHDEIEHYIDEFAPYDKAGAYGIQDWIGLCKVSHIEGSFFTIMGLPVDMVYEALKQW